MNSPNPQYARFSQLLNQIRLEVDQLKKKNQALIEENEKLKAKLEKVDHKSSGLFPALDESDKIGMQHQINGLIAKIDQHLGS